LLNEDVVRSHMKKFKLSQFDCIEDVLIQAQLRPDDVVAVALEGRTHLDSTGNVTVDHGIDGWCD
jgi:hypothetical protein